jgi:hypothetical protein
MSEWHCFHLDGTIKTVVLPDTRRFLDGDTPSGIFFAGYSFD